MLDVQGLSDDVRDRHAGIKRGVGVLEDHGGLPAELFDVLCGPDGFSPVDDLAVRGFVEVQDRASRRRLAAAGFADEPQGLSLHDVEGDVVHGLQGSCLEKARADRKILFQMADPDEGFTALICAAHCFPPSFAFLMFIQHAAAWLSLIRKRSHFSLMQIFIAASHRGAKAQPLGMFSRSIGVPLIGWSL